MIPKLPRKLPLEVNWHHNVAASLTHAKKKKKILFKLVPHLASLAGFEFDT
jgi:hypothetical protein